MKKTVILQNILNKHDVKKLEGVEHAYMVGHDVAIVGFVDGSEYYYTNYKIIKK